MIAGGLFSAAFGAQALAGNDTAAAPATTSTDVSVIDPLFEKPYVDVDEWRDSPVRHRYVHGGFEGTQTRFSFYFPPKKQYQGRFFQHVTPVPDSEHLATLGRGEEDKIGFSIASGAYFIETNGGGPLGSGGPASATDGSISAYRANAAAAQYSRTLAAKMYGAHRPFGYIYGGSGGGFRAIGSLENTQGVWDGAVPYVIGSTTAIPNVFTVRMHALRVLRERFPHIIDALEPGGSGDMYAGLSAAERAALMEVTKMGFPPRSWFGYRTMGMHGLAAVAPGVMMADPGYFTDFWTVPGYLGADAPETLAKDRVQLESSIAALLTAAALEALAPGAGRQAGAARGNVDTAFKDAAKGEAETLVGVRLAAPLPKGGFYGADLILRSGSASGKRVLIVDVVGDVLILAQADQDLARQLRVGDRVEFDNSRWLALQTYHRHQVPPAEFKVWDQFRDEDGKPIYPQRPRLLGPSFARAATGSLPSGRFQGKMIVVQALWDREAFPWHADWYRSKVQEHLGAKADAHFRLWYVDRALHGDNAVREDATRTVSYLGALHHALRDLAAWVEQGVPPPESTQYQVVDGQMVMPDSAKERRGIQPTVRLEVGAADHTTVSPNSAVELTARIDLPPGAGKLVAVEWDFDGIGDFPQRSKLPKQRQGQPITVKRTHRFLAPGTYFPTVRAIAQRNGDAQTEYARIANLARVRVVVKPE